jgi:hypothetical protein
MDVLLQFFLTEWHKGISITSFFTLFLVGDAQDKFSRSICAVLDLALLLATCVLTLLLFLDGQP